MIESSKDPEAVRTTTQLLSSAGQPWWTLTFVGSRDVLGRLTVARPPHRRC